MVDEPLGKNGEGATLEDKNLSDTAQAPMEAVGVSSYVHHTVKSSLHLVSRIVDRYVISHDALPSHVSNPDGNGRYRSVGVGFRVATSPATAARQSERRRRDHFNVQAQKPWAGTVPADNH